MTPEEILVLLESTANMLRGMTLDPAIPKHAKEAMAHRISELDHAAQRAEPQIVATFETSSEGFTGTVSARVKRVERHDDGTLEVIIDHWPARPERT